MQTCYTSLAALQNRSGAALLHDVRLVDGTGWKFGAPNVSAPSENLDMFQAGVGQDLVGQLADIQMGSRVRVGPSVQGRCQRGFTRPPVTIKDTFHAINEGDQVASVGNAH